MVQLMEAWFLADRETLRNYYGSGFNVGALPANPSIEDIRKTDVESGLRNATRRCGKGAYNKRTHASEPVGLINTSAVYDACPNFARLIDFLRDNAGV